MTKGTDTSIWLDKKSRDIAKRICEALAKKRSNNGISSDPLLDLYLTKISSCIKREFRPTRCLGPLIAASPQPDHTFSIDTFENEVLKANRKLKDLKHHAWRFYAPLHITFNRPNNRFACQFEGLRIVVSTDRIPTNKFVDLVSKCGCDRTLQLYRHSRKRGLTYFSAVAIFQSRGPTAHSAWSKVASQFDLFRGALEFAFGGGGWGFGTPPKPQRQIQIETWMMAECHETGEIEPVHFDYPISTLEIDRKLWNPTNLDFQKHRNFRFHQRRVRKRYPPNSCNTLLADCFRMYALAMDQPHSAMQLLHYWQIAEAITLSKEFGGDTKLVCKRIAYFFNLPDLSIRDACEVLYVIANARNNYVHHGDESNISDFIVQSLRWGCQDAMAWIATNCHLIKSHRELIDFFELHSKSEGQLINHRKLVDDVLEYKSRDTR